MMKRRWVPPRANAGQEQRKVSGRSPTYTQSYRCQLFPIYIKPLKICLEHNNIMKSRGQCECILMKTRQLNEEYCPGHLANTGFTVGGKVRPENSRELLCFVWFIYYYIIYIMHNIYICLCQSVAVTYQNHQTGEAKEKRENTILRQTYSIKDARERYLAKLMSINNIDPYELTANSWSADEALLLPMAYLDITNYLVYGIMLIPANISERRILKMSVYF